MADSLILGPAAVQKPYDPDDEPNPANPGGISNNELRRRQQALDASKATSGYQGGGSAAGGYAGGTGGAVAGAAGAYNAGSDKTRAAFDATHKVNQGNGISGTDVYRAVAPVARMAIDPIGGAASLVGGPVAQIASGPAGAALVAGETVARAVNNTTKPGQATPPVQRPTLGNGQNPTQPPAARPTPAPATGATPAAGGATFAPTQADYSGVDAEMSGLRQARQDFYNQLDKLSGVDPFGNQAFMQKATDRAVAQAAGTAAMAQGGPAALAGANRAAQGVQSQLAARGIQDVAEQGRRDAVQAAQLGIETVKGIESVSGQLTQTELKKVDQATAQAELNLRGYLGGRELDQKERDSLRQLAGVMAQVDMERYKTDTAYRQNVDDNLTAMYVSDNSLKGVIEQIKAQENISTGDIVMGLMGMGSGLAQGLVMKSDRRAKFDVRDPDLRDLQDYLGNTKGKFYRYKEPHKPGRKPGSNFGPMAQDLAKSKIGRTVLVNDADGQLSVDTGRLALADHAALAALAREVEKLKGGKK